MCGFSGALVFGILSCLFFSASVKGRKAGLSMSDMVKFNSFRSELASSDWLTRSMPLEPGPKAATDARCNCHQNQCQCCTKMNHQDYNVEGCFKAVVNEQTKEMTFNVHANENKMFETTMKIDSPKASDCQDIPNSQSYGQTCLTFDNKMNDDQSITTCSHMDIKMGSDVGATADFECLYYKDGQLNLKGTDSNAKLLIKYKEPMYGAIDYLSNNKS